MMRGRPLRELLLLVAVCGFLVWPLWRVTRSGAREGSAVVVDAAGHIPVWVQLHFTEAPMGFRLYSQGEVVWEATRADIEQEQPLELVWDEHRQGDLELVATWGHAARRVTEVRVSPPEGRSRSLTFWHDDVQIQEPLFFP